MSSSSSRCIKKLDHFMADSQGKTIKLEESKLDPNFEVDPATLKQKFSDEMKQRPREGLAALLGIDSFIDLATPPFELSISLVDLTKDKIDHPQYVSLNDTMAIYPASLGKIAPLYAAHQLKYDVTTKRRNMPGKSLTLIFDSIRDDWTASGVRRRRSSKLPDLNGQPDLEKILTVSDTDDLIFSPMFKKQMNSITHGDNAGAMNHAAGALIEKIGWPFMGSALLQSGLCNEQSGGIWLWGNYAGKRWICDVEPVKLYPKQRLHEAKALKVATYFTLMAQKRLVDGQTSSDIQEVLKDGDLRWYKPELLKALDALGSEHPYANAVDVQVYCKPGGYPAELPPGWKSTGMLVQRESSVGPIRYVVACLTSSAKHAHRTLGDMLGNLLIPCLDSVIVANNHP
jgi:hypothetical protein